MARRMNPSNVHIYRVVVLEKHYSDASRIIKTVYGPYEHKRTAGFVKSYMTTDGSYLRNPRVVDSWIEESDPIWTKSD